MRKVFIPTPLPLVRKLPLLADPAAGDNRLFQHIARSEFAGIIEPVQSPEDAEFFLLPHPLTDLRNAPEYLEEAVSAARAAGKRIIIFTSQDDPAPIHIPEAIIFRPSAYKSTLLQNEILLPAMIEDIGKMYGVQPLPKGTKPTAGFMGKAGFERSSDFLKYLLKNYFLRHGPKREGLYFRRKSLDILATDSRITLTATKRKRFGAHRRTIELPPEQARAEYIASLRDSLFTLAPRGDGNYSLRFYETLAMGRIPILIDTDMALPLEETIPYDDFIVRVPGDRLHELSEHVWKFWNSRDEAGLAAAQRKARAAFEDHLHMPVFLRHAFETL